MVALPFARRIYDTPSLMIVAEADDITLWDLEIGAFNAIPATTNARTRALTRTVGTVVWVMDSNVSPTARGGRESHSTGPSSPSANGSRSSNPACRS